MSSRDTSALFVCRALAIALAVVPMALVPLGADDWPTYRHDVRRSGVSGEDLGPPLVEAWVFRPPHPPVPAWGDPQPQPVENQLELPRSRFDDAFHVAAAGDAVYFGSSADHSLHALDARSGGTLWTFVTDGPIRFAPTVWNQRVYVGSDDGRAYCLDASTGSVVWTFAAAPASRMLLGNGKMISLWPVRTGVLVVDGIAYFGAGVFPGEGVFLYAVRADDGKLIWKNDTFGRGGQGTVSPQGYLLASRERLWVSSGRSMPAAFRRDDGRFLFHRNFSWREIGMFGGTSSLIAEDLLYNGIEQVLAVHEQDGRLAFTEGIPEGVPSEGTRRLIVTDDALYLLTGREAIGAWRKPWTADRSIEELRRFLPGVRKQVEAKPGDAKARESLSSLEKKIGEAAAARAPLGDAIRWKVPCGTNESVALTRRVLFAGGADVVVGLDVGTGAEIWSARVEGRARGLAAAAGRLLVSTDRGTIHCFASTPGSPVAAAAAVSPPGAVGDPCPEDALAESFGRTAEALLEESGIRRGHALVLGGGTGRLALELARRSDLVVYSVDADPSAVARAREAFAAAGVHGMRAVALRSELDSVPYADYFANLVVCESGPDSERPRAPASEVLRMLKPCGGVAFVGRLVGAAETASPPVSPGLDGWLKELRGAAAEGSAGAPSETAVRIAAGDGRARIDRGPLPGAGSWTHQYAEPGNTATGDDRRVRGPIGVLWFGEPGPRRMPSRHSASVAPLSVGGRMFTQGENIIQAHDAYNGLLLWEREMPGALRLRMSLACSNLAATEDSLFVAIGDSCHRLDAATGNLIRTYKAPPPRAGDPGAAASEGAAPAPPATAPPRSDWEYVACTGGLLHGSRGASALFAFDVATGELRWVREAGNLQTTTIGVSEGRLVYVDRKVTEEQSRKALEQVSYEARTDRLGKEVKPDVRLIVALDASTGETRWERPQYVSDCVGVGATGGELTAMVTKGVVLLCGQPWNGHFWREFFAGEFSRRSLIALDAGDGRLLWSGRRGYRSRPIIVGDTIVAEPWAYDLKTGAERTRVNPVTGQQSRWQMARPGHHCGGLAACQSLLFFRSGTTAYYDLDADYGTAHFGAQRPGCWINCIPAGGVILMPEASSGCVCPFSIHCTIAFEPRPEQRAWGMFSSPDPLAPLRRLAVNLGAPGDRRDAAGDLWLAYPRPYTGVTETDRRLVLDVPLQVDLGAGGGSGPGEYFAPGEQSGEVAGTDDDWIYASGVRGPARIILPLTRLGAEAPATREYRVRLHFIEPEAEQAGQRVFDVAVQGGTAIERLDVFKEAGGGHRALVKEVRGVTAEDRIELELRPVVGTPILCGFEVVAEN